MTAPGTTLASGFSEAGLESIQRMMQDYVTSGKSAGMLTLVSRGGRIAQLSCHGQADIASNRPI
ncbi:MAG: hypothetical protein GY802_12505, partial [Gammaproteobacteria bacterium]|nr:hypothetical protein [Gammaproteobacteria bacterium]